MDMKRFFLYAIVIAALALAGCGGGGDRMVMDPPPTDPPTTDPPTTDPPTTDPPTTDPPTTDPDPDEPMVDHGAVIAGIVNPSTPGDPSTARGTDAPNRPGNAASDAEAFNVTAGEVDMKPTTTIGAGTNTAEELNLDTLDKDDMAGTPMKSLSGQFKNQEMDTTLGQFDGSVHEKTVKMVKDTLMVYTNLDDPKGVLYNTYYSDSAAEDKDGVTSGASGVLTLSLGEDTGMSDLFSGSKIPTTAGTFESIPATDTADTVNVKENEFMGMFHGISGTYTCSGAAGESCRIDRGAMDKLTIAAIADNGNTGGSATLTFTPTATGDALADLMVQDVLYDPDYLSFGYWVQATEKDGKTTYGVGTFFDGSQPYDAVSLGNLEGEATYSGKAAGMYGRKTLDQYGQVMAGTDTSGHFTANAELMVRFGGMDVAESKRNEIEGTVSNFMDGDQMISPGWSAELKTVALDGNGQSLTSFSGDTTGNGNWRGAFFGNPAETDPITPDAERHPTGVAGDFTAHFPNGHVIGAFGATVD
jgi:hypothetical protein